MTIENMKDYLVHKYPSSRWASKVKVMSDDQILAIYFRLTRATAPKRIVVPPRAVQQYYQCEDCHGTFIADGAELTECRYCGSSKIFRPESVHIRKDTMR